MALAATGNPRAVGANVAGLWPPGVSEINRKPTGMICVDGDLYLFSRPGYNVVIPTKFLDPDSRGGWLASSLSDSWFDGMYYNMDAGKPRPETSLRLAHQGSGTSSSSCRYRRM